MTSNRINGQYTFSYLSMVHVKAVILRRGASYSKRAIRIAHHEFTADEMWALYREERDVHMKVRFYVIAPMLEG